MGETQERIQAAESAIEHELVVVESFLGYVRGQMITDADKIKELLESEWSAHFVKKPKQAPADPSAS